MPKRRVRTAAQIKAQAKASRAAAEKRRREALGYSHPENKTRRLRKAYYRGELNYTPPGVGGRRSKLGGKAYTHKTASNFKPAQEALDLIAGKTTIAQTAALHAASGIDHNGPGLKASPRGGGHKIAPKPPKSAKALIKPKKVDQHGSGTGLTSAYRYLPVNVKKRKGK